jgi:hypothetical protein
MHLLAKEKMAGVGSRDIAGKRLAKYIQTEETGY